jgi:sn-glycerol 3-phosphate transport system ATP-binding protein
MSVYGNMAYGLKNQGTPKDEIERRVNEAAQILELGGLLDRKPRQLSGGQRQRVAMGRAIVREPAAFLFDEPLSNLDAKLRVQMRLEIKRLQRRLKTTSIYVTHDQVEAMTMADRLVVMNGGLAEQIGTPMEVYDHPASVFVAGFIGSPAMNFLPGRVNDDEVSVIVDGTVPMVLPLQNGQGKGHKGRPVTIGIRPEHIEPATDTGNLQLDVELSEPLGADTLLHGRVADAGHDLTVRLSGHHMLTGGTRMGLAVTPAHVQVFDADSGRRIAAG